jgi:hypothetical protein
MVLLLIIANSLVCIKYGPEVISCCSVSSVFFRFIISAPEKGDGDAFVVAYALFYGLDIFRAIQQGLPGIKMPRRMKIAVGDIGIFFEADYIKDIVPVGYLPGVYIFGEALPVVPEVVSVFTALA